MKKILLVDDDESIQLLYYEELVGNGYQVLSALNGEEGLKKFREDFPDLVILDIQMPGMNGIEVLRQMKMENAAVPIILSSAYHEYKQDLGAWASDEYVVKSADIDELLSAVRKFIGV
ncbi:MAG: response regulator [Desulfoprunum sp.]|nr:response regulator [Desulfoprunum sp.]